jgi:hypothetical protein
MCHCAFLRASQGARARSKQLFWPVSHFLHQNETTTGWPDPKIKFSLKINSPLCTKKLSNNFKKWKSYAKQQCYAKKIKRACGVNDTACTVHAVSLTPHAKYDTACTIDERSERPWQPLKGISIKNTYAPELSYPTTKKNT